MWISSSNLAAATMYITNAGSTAAYAFWVSGNAHITGLWSSSDLRWKKNIIPVENSLDKVMQLNPVQFDWRTTEFPDLNFSKDHQIGVIAQEVEKVFPELVKTDADGFKAVAYDKLAVISISAIKQQQLEIEKLQNTVEALQKENSQLKLMQAEIDQLKALLNKK
jgi:RecJ-like exonuclease